MLCKLEYKVICYIKLLVPLIIQSLSLYMHNILIITTVPMNLWDVPCISKSSLILKGSYLQTKPNI